MHVEREQLKKEVEAVLYDAISGAEMALESNRFGFVADQILSVLQSKGLLQPPLPQAAVSRSVPPTVAEVVPEAQKLLDAVKKHHPQMSMETQLDLYMSYHDLKNSLGRQISG